MTEASSPGRAPAPDGHPAARSGVRTMLDLVIVSRRWTAEECVRKFAATAAAMGESATLSVAQLKRWRRGVLVTLPRPTAWRVAEELFGHCLG